MKKLINTALLQEQLKRYWPIGAVTMLVFMLAIIWPIYINPSTHIHGSGRPVHYMTTLILGANTAFMLAMVIVPFCTALALFSYTYKVSSVAAFHSFPVNRMQLFFTHMTAGLILFLVPLVMLSLIMLIPVRQAGEAEAVVYGTVMLDFFTISRVGIPVGYLANPARLVVGFFIRGVLGFSFYFGVFILAASIAGNRVIAVLISFALAVFPVALVALWEVISAFYIFGHGLVAMRNIGGAAILTHPFLWSVGRHEHERAPLGIHRLYPAGGISDFSVILSHSLIIISVFVLAYMAYRLRSQERAGDSVVFTPVKRVLIFLFAMSGMLYLGAFMYTTIGYRAGLYIGFVPGFVIAYFVAQMIAEKTFRVGHKARQLIPYSAVALGGYLLVLLVVNIGLWGYVRRVPEMPDIVGVHVGNHGITRGFTEDSFTSDPATIARVHELHQDILGARGSVLRLMQNPRLRDWSSLGELTIAYRLDNGRVMSRTYTLPRQYFSELGAIELLHSFHVRFIGYTVLRSPEDIMFAELTFIPENVREEIVAQENAIAEAFASNLDVDEINQLHRELEELYASSYELLAFVNSFLDHDMAGFVQAVIYDLMYVSESNVWSFWDNNIIIDVVPYIDTGHNRLSLRVPLDGYTAAWVRNNASGRGGF